MKRGPLVVLSGPSGSGKSTVIERLLARSRLPLHLAVSATTRRPRPNEQNGVNYHFLDKPHFEELVRGDAFIEHAEVFGNSYGTLWREVEPYRDRRIGVILEIDVQGAMQVKSRCPDAVMIFLRASSLDAYEARLRRRGTEDDAAIQRRLAGARRELELGQGYEHTVINDDLDQAVTDLEGIVARSFEEASHA